MTGDNSLHIAHYHSADCARPFCRLHTYILQSAAQSSIVQGKQSADCACPFCRLRVSILQIKQGVSVCRLSTFILQIKQPFCRLVASILQIAHVHSADWSRPICRLCTTILQIVHVHSADWSRPFCRLVASILQIGSVQLIVISTIRVPFVAARVALVPCFVATALPIIAFLLAIALAHALRSSSG